MYSDDGYKESLRVVLFYLSYNEHKRVYMLQQIQSIPFPAVRVPELATSHLL